MIRDKRKRKNKIQHFNIESVVNSFSKPQGAVVVKKWVDPTASWTKNESLCADLKIPASLFMEAATSFAEGGGSEIDGYMYQEDGVVKWYYHSSVGKAVSVDNLAVNEAEAVKKADELGYWLNVQFHTHPGMGVFWSATDIDNQAERADMLLENDSIHVVVYDGVYWLTRVIANIDGKIEYNDGVVSISGCDKPLPTYRKPRSYNNKTNAKTTGKPYVLENDYDGRWWEDEWDQRQFWVPEVYGAPLVTERPMSDDAFAEKMVDAYDRGALDSLTDEVVDRYGNNTDSWRFYMATDHLAGTRGEVADAACKLWESKLF